MRRASRCGTSNCCCGARHGHRGRHHGPSHANDHDPRAHRDATACGRNRDCGRPTASGDDPARHDGHDCRRSIVHRDCRGHSARHGNRGCHGSHPRSGGDPPRSRRHCRGGANGPRDGSPRSPTAGGSTSRACRVSRSNRACRVSHCAHANRFCRVHRASHSSRADRARLIHLGRVHRHLTCHARVRTRDGSTHLTTCGSGARNYCFFGIGTLMRGIRSPYD